MTPQYLRERTQRIIPSTGSVFGVMDPLKHGAVVVAYSCISPSSHPYRSAESEMKWQMRSLDVAVGDGIVFG